jgi:CheY-like chemotaxis protein
MNGWELVERARLSWPGMHIVLATGWGAAIGQADARTKGVDAVIAKPYRPPDLELLAFAQSAVSAQYSVVCFRNRGGRLPLPGASQRW